MSDLATFRTALVLGEYDEDLDTIALLLTERRKAIRAQRGALNVAQATPGTLVRINQTVRPQYLRGLTGTVDSLSGKLVLVKLDKPKWAGKYANQITGIIRLPPDLIEIVP